MSKENIHSQICLMDKIFRSAVRANQTHLTFKQLFDFHFALLIRWEYLLTARKEIMVEQAAEDYAKILQSINLDREVS